MWPAPRPTWRVWPRSRCGATVTHSAPPPCLPPRRLIRRWRWCRLEAPVDRDQCADQQDPADQQGPLADKSPPVGKAGIDEKGAEDTEDRQNGDAENVGSADFWRCDLDSSR